MIDRDTINKIIDYMLEHYHEGITVKEVADHFHYSQFYFNRAFKEFTGESVYAFIKRLKLDQSAVDLKLEKQRAITEIGLDYGYSSSNYSSAFRKHHNVSPAEYRTFSNSQSMQNPFHPDQTTVFDTFEAYDRSITVIESEGYTVFYERFIGNYYELKERWPRFIAEHKDFIHEKTLLLERYYDDPSITSLERCICDLCMTLDRPLESGSTTSIKAAKFAVHRFEGKIEDIFGRVQGLYRIWLPDSGFEMTERYGLNIYRGIDLENGTVVMDICIPIK